MPFESAILEAFRRLVEEGYVYRGVKPVHWCVTDQTALADAEIEYADRKDPSIYVRFALRSDPDGIFPDTSLDRYVIIWTTTPWTIPANVAVAVHPELTYAIVEAQGALYIVAEERIAAVADALEVEEWTVVKSVKGSELTRMLFQHPLADRTSPVVTADYVTLDEGTGIVHTAPGHGREDFLTGQKYGLPVLSPVDNAGRFTIEAGEAFAGQTIWQGNETVVAALREAGALLGLRIISHSYPHCWRCHQPVIFRATAQWFMSIDHNNHRGNCLKAIDDVRWFPQESVNRIRSMVSSRPDWCLSRQRAWGVGIPVFYCKDCGTEVLDSKVIANVRDMVAEHSSDVWFERPADELILPGYRCVRCKGANFEKESDIFDVWFDSGCTNRAVLDHTEWKDLTWPADVYLEGGDQHRGWFNSSLMVGVGTKHHAPYRQVITNGWTLDENGKAMHKSLGNAVSPDVVVEKYGADVLRLWVGSTDYFEDVRLGKSILEQVAGTYRQIRNALRVCVGNLFDFHSNTNSVGYSNLQEIDRYILHRLTLLLQEVQKAYDVYEFHKGMQAVKQFCTVDLSAFYIDVLKDRLYADAPLSRSRRAAQTVLLEIASSLARLLSPILSFTAEEVWQVLPIADKPVSVELASFPTANEKFLDYDLGKRWTRLLEIRDEVNRAIETARQAKLIGKPLESAVHLFMDTPTCEFLLPFGSDLPAIFLVSEVSISSSDDRRITVSPAIGQKCARCWLMKTDVAEETGLCGRCGGVVGTDTGCP